MNITAAIDIDGTITNIDFMKYFFNNKLNKNEIIKNKQLKKLVFFIIYYYAYNYTIRKDSINIINDLNDLNININYITKRASLFEDKTLESDIIKIATYNFMYKNNLPFNNIIFTNNDKLDECLNINADFIIEDNPKTILSLSKHIPVIVITTPYNKRIYGNNIYRADNWQEVKQIIIDNFIIKESPKKLVK